MAENYCIEFIKKNYETYSYKPEHLDLDPSNQHKDGYHLLLNKQYMYRRCRKNKLSTNWLCKEYKNGCKASITTDFDGKIIRQVIEHRKTIHNPNGTKSIPNVVNYQIHLKGNILDIFSRGTHKCQ